MYTLKLSLVAAEQRCAAVEQTVRAEVSAASESQAKEIEEMCVNYIFFHALCSLN
jgi:hypothetical protein